jgi:hypothetical protein
LKKHDFDLKSARKRDIKMGRFNITQTLQEQNKVIDTTLEKQKQSQAL